MEKGKKIIKVSKAEKKSMEKDVRGEKARERAWEGARSIWRTMCKKCTDLLIRSILETGLLRERTECGEAAWEEAAEEQAGRSQNTYIKIKTEFYIH